jgi:hypothetical protein
VANDDYDDRNNGYDDDAGGDSQEVIRLALEKVSTPGTMLLMFGLFSLALALASVAFYAITPETLVKPLYDLQAEALAKQPNNAQKLPPYEEYERTFMIQSLASAGFGALCSIPIILGALKMRQLRTYGLAMTGTVMALIPCTNSCCLIGLPLGIWAMIVLVNADVKAGFQAMARRSL